MINKWFANIIFLSALGIGVSANPKPTQHSEAEFKELMQQLSNDDLVNAKSQERTAQGTSSILR